MIDAIRRSKPRWHRAAPCHVVSSMLNLSSRSGSQRTRLHKPPERVGVGWPFIRVPVCALTCFCVYCTPLKRRRNISNHYQLQNSTMPRVWARRRLPLPGNLAHWPTPADRVETGYRVYDGDAVSAYGCSCSAPVDHVRSSWCIYDDHVARAHGYSIQLTRDATGLVAVARGYGASQFAA